MRNVEWPWWRLRRCRSQRPSLCPVDGVPDGRGASVAALLQIEVDIDTLDRADLDAVVDAAEAVGSRPVLSSTMSSVSVTRPRDRDAVARFVWILSRERSRGCHSAAGLPQNVVFAGERSVQPDR
jgi:hypothetical protein